MLARTVLAVPAAVVVTLAASCTSVSNPVATTVPDTSTVKTTTDVPQEPPPADPPERFASEGIPVGPQDAIVGQSTAYSVAEPDEYGAPPEVAAVDLRTGEERWRSALSAQPSIGLTGPASSTLGVTPQPDGGEHLVYSGIRTEQGAGTQEDDHHVVVGTLDSMSGAEQWTVTTPLPEELADDITVSVAGADARFVVCSVSASGMLPRAVVVNVAAGTAAWTEPGFQPLGLIGTMIIGTGLSETYEVSGPLQALTADTLAPAWTRPDLDDVGNKVIAPHVVQAPGRGISDPNTYLLDPNTGAVIADLPDRYDCRSDQRDTVICESFNALIGVDAATGGQLWQLPDESRTRPALRSAFHGRVYASAEHTAVTLDTRTGRDVTPDAVIAPEVVVPGFGLVHEDHTLYAYPATS